MSFLSPLGEEFRRGTATRLKLGWRWLPPIRTPSLSWKLSTQTPEDTPTSTPGLSWTIVDTQTWILLDSLVDLSLRAELLSSPTSLRPICWRGFSHKAWGKKRMRKVKRRLTSSVCKDRERSTSLIKEQVTAMDHIPKSGVQRNP